MKKLLILIAVLFLSISAFAKPKDRFIDPETRFIYAYLENSGITILPEVVVTAHRNPLDTIKNKKVERDDLYFTPSVDLKIKHAKFRPNPDRYLVDTLIKNNDTTALKTDDPFDYYDNSFSYNRFFNNFSFSMWYGSYPYWHGYYGWPYNYGYYSLSNPFWYDFWWDWNYPYFATGWGWYGPYWAGSWYRPYWYHTPYYWHQSHYWNNNWYSHQGYQNNIQRRERYSFMTQTHQIRRESTQKSLYQSERRMLRPSDRPMYNVENRRNYTPNYERPRMGERPLYNNSRVERNKSDFSNNNQMRRTENIPVNRVNNNAPQTRRSDSYSPNRNYSAPTQRYSAPSRNYSAPSQGSYGSSRSYNGGSSSFGSRGSSSGGGSFSSGGSSNSGSHSSSGSRR